MPKKQKRKSLGKLAGEGKKAPMAQEPEWLEQFNEQWGNNIIRAVGENDNQESLERAITNIKRHIESDELPHHLTITQCRDLLEAYTRQLHRVKVTKPGGDAWGRLTRRPASVDALSESLRSHLVF